MKRTGCPSGEAASPSYLHLIEPGLWRLEVWVQPGAGRTELAGEYQGRLKIRVAAPANDNKANDALIDYVAGLCGVRRRSVELAAGHASRKKTLHLALSAQTPPEALRGC